MSLSSPSDFNLINPATTKGDLIARTSTGASRLAVGSNDTVLVADSAATTGVKWGSALTAAGLTATATEINNIADASARNVVSNGATLALTPTNAQKNIKVERATGQTITLPIASGSGDTYRFFVTADVTSNAAVIKVADATDAMYGIILGADEDGEGATGYTWNTDAGDDTITLDGTATGGKIGDFIELVDLAANVWHVRGFIQQSGGSEATPFSATVS